MGEVDESAMDPAGLKVPMNLRKGAILPTQLLLTNRKAQPQKQVMLPRVQDGTSMFTYYLSLCIYAYFKLTES